MPCPTHQGVASTKKPAHNEVGQSSDRGSYPWAAGAAESTPCSAPDAGTRVSRPHALMGRRGAGVRAFEGSRVRAFERRLHHVACRGGRNATDSRMIDTSHVLAPRLAKYVNPSALLVELARQPNDRQEIAQGNKDNKDTVRQKYYTRPYLGSPNLALELDWHRPQSLRRVLPSNINGDLPSVSRFCACGPTQPPRLSSRQVERNMSTTQPTTWMARWLRAIGGSSLLPVTSLPSPAERLVTMPSGSMASRPPRLTGLLQLLVPPQSATGRSGDETPRSVPPPLQRQERS